MNIQSYIFGLKSLKYFTCLLFMDSTVPCIILIIGFRDFLFAFRYQLKFDLIGFSYLMNWVNTQIRSLSGAMSQTCLYQIFRQTLLQMCAY